LGQPSLQSGVPSLSLSASPVPQPQTPGAVFVGSFGQPSTQSAVPSLSLSVSGCPHPHWPGAVLAASFGQPSLQSGVPSLSLSIGVKVQTPFTQLSLVHGLSSLHDVTTETASTAQVLLTHPVVVFRARA